MTRGPGLLDRLPDPGHVVGRVHASERVHRQRVAFDRFHDAMQIWQRPRHPLDDGPQSTLMLRMPPPGIVATAGFVMVQADGRHASSSRAVDRFESLEREWAGLEVDRPPFPL